MIHYVSVYDIKVDLSKYLKHIEKGDEVVITKHGKAVAKLIPYTTPGIKFGLLAGQGHPPMEVEDFEWSEDEIAEWYRNPL